ncbi:MAG: PilZ domain-containing protein [Nevskia sp.]|nr:PilZ domain-containing protein [Nevskia sp.]
MSTRERRLYYRVHYPSALRPTLKLGGGTLPVIDISERGVRFVRDQPILDHIGETVVATVQFRSGMTAEVEGKIVRVGERDVALELEPGISFRIIVREQRLLIEMSPYFPV